jgi:hypothetical protein
VTDIDQVTGPAGLLVSGGRPHERGRQGVDWSHKDRLVVNRWAAGWLGSEEFPSSAKHLSVPGVKGDGHRVRSNHTRCRGCGYLRRRPDSPSARRMPPVTLLVLRYTARRATRLP